MLVRELVVLALVLGGSAAAETTGDCAGGTVDALRVRPGGVVLRASVTAPGMTRAALLAGGRGLDLRIADANDPAADLWRLALPAERLVTRGDTTKYDRQGIFAGRVVLKDARGQADTVTIAAVASGVDLGAGAAARELRVHLETPGGCARTCVSPCRPGRSGRLRCRRSARYVPFADEGFGALARRTRGPTSALCGLAVDPRPGCDFLIAERCLLPYPSSHFLAPDAATPTGLRIRYGPETLPANVRGVHVDPTDWNTLDGFSPGPMLIASFPDTGRPVDLAASGVAFHTEALGRAGFARSLETDHPIVLMEAATGARVVHFAELDLGTDDLRAQALIVRPGVRLKDGSRYLVALRRLVDTAGAPLRPRLPFRALRDGGDEAQLAAACGSACAGAIAARRPAFASMFGILAANGVDPAELILAWDFTTASTEALTGWMVSIRDQAFAQGTPAFAVTRVDDGNGRGRNADVWARVEGTFEAPLFMTADAPASRLNLVGGVPAQNGFARVSFVVDVPRSAVDPAGARAPARPTIWGHGLFGTRSQVSALSGFANRFNAVVGGVDMQGMSTPDVTGAILPYVLADLSNFHFVPERLHQGFLHHLLLARLMVDPVRGFNAHPAFRLGPGARGVIDTTEVFYAGGSQGGIFGLALMAIAEDFRRGFLSVPAANYSTLLHRALPFVLLRDVLRIHYPDRLDEQLLIALIQQLWDRAEPQGYLPHVLAGDLSEPPVPHQVLIHMASHDSQVSNLGTEIMVRSLGIPQLAPVHRSFFEIPEASAPLGSAFVEIDTGGGVSRCLQPGTLEAGSVCRTDADCPGPGDALRATECTSGIPPLTNTPPAFDNGAHGAASFSEAAFRQIDAFMRPGGQVVQFCEGPCDPS